jgi:hypothetical protein
MVPTAPPPALRRQAGAGVSGSWTRLLTCAAATLAVVLSPLVTTTAAVAAQDQGN